jgi:Ca-activated chloride channel family protein
MRGKPLETVKEAALELVRSLGENDRLSVIAFDHRAEVIVANRDATDLGHITAAIASLDARGGTAIDEGIKLGIQEAAAGAKDRVSHLFLLTDGENEHGNNDRCLKLAGVASEYNLTVNSLGFGNHWNQDILEKVADLSGGTLAYIEKPEQASVEFTRLFTRLQSVGLTNAYLTLELDPEVRMAELKPIAQVAPETIELAAQTEGTLYTTRLGDLMVNEEKEILINFYLPRLSEGTRTIARARVRYDDPSIGKTGLYSESLPITIESRTIYRPLPDETVQQSILTLAKYRQTQIAEERLKQGDRSGAATMLQSAANTALQLGETNAATVLQDHATRLQTGEELSEGELKKTRMIAKTRLEEGEP